MLGYKVPEPDEAMLISGGKGADGAPFRVVTGHGAFVLPFFRKARFLTPVDGRGRGRPSRA